MFFTAVNPMFIDHYRERDYDVTEPRIAVYKQIRKINQHSVLGHIEGSSEEGIDVLSNQIERDHPSRHFTCDVHREGGDKFRRSNAQQSL